MTRDQLHSLSAPTFRHRYELPTVRELPRRWDSVTGQMVVDPRPPKRHPAA
jgi:hypothetical protein